MCALLIFAILSIPFGKQNASILQKKIYKKAPAFLQKKSAAKRTLSNKLVTLKGNETRIRSWEISTPKHVRAGAVDQVVSAYKAAFSNLKNGTINHFNLESKRKKMCPWMPLAIQKASIKNDCGVISIYPTRLGQFAMGKRTLKKWF